ncbi:DNA primase, partial [bacterium]|nr:DNA primase [bacterium]
MYSQSILDDIKNRASIVELVGERVQLKKAGRNFRGPCPFHSETKPSFIVSEEKQIYHCFGCGEGGNVFTFLMKFEGLNFIEAVQCLADRVGITLPKLTQGGRGVDEESLKKKKTALKINKLALDYFINNLKDSQKGIRASNYLKSRGFESEFFTQHFLGYAEDRWD